VIGSPGYYAIDHRFQVVEPIIIALALREQQRAATERRLWSSRPLRKVRVIGDEEGAIVDAFNALRHRYTYIFTTCRPIVTSPPPASPRRSVCR
jgi:hypothetical protein